MAIRKYQAFISSTYRDLHEARERVTWEVLKIGFIPVGMENFSAMDERGWATIAKAIDQSDYYVVLIAGLYGSLDETGKSWTQREYEYAVERHVPVLAFVRGRANTPGDMVEQGQNAILLEAFIGAVQNKHHCETWTSVDDLRAKAPVALLKMAREDESEGRERPGWYRDTASAAALREFAELSAENRELRERLAAQAPKSKEVDILRRVVANEPILVLKATGETVRGRVETLEVDELNNRLRLRLRDDAGRVSVLVESLSAVVTAWRDHQDVWRLKFRSL